MPRLIWVFAGRTLTLLVLSCRGSNLISVTCIIHFYTNTLEYWNGLNKDKNVNRKVHGMPQSRTAANSRHQEEEKNNKTYTRKTNRCTKTSSFLSKTELRIIYSYLSDERCTFFKTSKELQIECAKTLSDHRLTEQSACYKITPFTPSGPVHPYWLDESSSSFRGVWCTFCFSFYL